MQPFITKSLTIMSEFMQGVIRKSDTVRKIEIVFSPFIDLPPTDLICVYSALNLICDTATRR